MVHSVCHSYPYYNSTTLNRQNYNLTSCLLPQQGRNFCVFDKDEVDFFVNRGEQALPALTDVLVRSNNEPQIVETLHVMNKMLDNGVKGIDKLYPYLSRFNNTTSPNIQSYLAGIYRKTQVPDAFGPLVQMLIQNSIRQNQNELFNPNEEIGGAILSYLSDNFRK